nr:venom serine carboxypeptidase [Onthophagus taurus]
MKMFILLTTILLFTSVNSFTNIYSKIPSLPVTVDPGPALYLTPFIEQGKIDEAKKLAIVKFNGFKNVLAYSGYLTVNKQYNSNMFFWFFPSFTNYKVDPVILWLQGGPGASSLIGLFAENGPFRPKTHGVKLRKYSWVQTHSVIYIDNPVGTGYSFTNGGYAQNETAVGNDLYQALLQFFQLFPELQKNDFFVTGESYAGKYVPAVSYTIHKNNPSAKLKINLKGLAIGNGLCDPINQLKYSDYLYQIGLIDINAKKLVQDYEAKGVELMKNKKWIEAFHLFDNLLNGDLNNHTSIFKNITGFDNYYNYLISYDPDDTIKQMGIYIQKSEVRNAIHVGNNTFNGVAQEVELNLMNDVMQSVAPWISELLSNYRVMIYNGQLDIIVAYPLTVNFLQNLQFSAAEEYKTASRHIWVVGNDIGGYVKVAGNLTEVLVRNAGHMVPGDQPQFGFDLISRFTRNKPFY